MCSIHSGWFWWYNDLPEHTLTNELRWCNVSSCQVPFQNLETTVDKRWINENTWFQKWSWSSGTDMRFWCSSFLRFSSAAVILRVHWCGRNPFMVPLLEHSSTTVPDLCHFIWNFFSTEWMMMFFPVWTAHSYSATARIQISNPPITSPLSHGLSAENCCCSFRMHLWFDHQSTTVWESNRCHVTHL